MEKKNTIGVRMFIAWILATTLLIIVSILGTEHTVQSSTRKELKPVSEEIQQNGEVSLKFVLDETDAQRSSLAFFTSHQYVEVRTGDEVLYKLDTTGGIWGHTTGNIWNFIVLPENVKEVSVSLTPCYPQTSGYHTQYYIGIGRELYADIMGKAFPSFLICIFIIAVGAYMLIYWIMVRKSAYIDHTLFYLGTFSVIMGAWSANETDVAVLLFHNRQASTFAAFILLMMMCIPFAMFVRSFLEIGDKRIWRFLCNISMLETVGCCILHFTGIYELRQSIVLTHVIIGCALLYLIYGIVRKLVYRQADTRLKICILALLLVITATFADIGNYYESNGSSGVYGRLSFLVFILVLGIESAKQTFSMLKKGRRAEELEQFALNDTMTGLYNRNAYNSYVERLEKCEGHMIVTFDLNNLKRCNDSYGHGAGDLYIINAAKTIEEVFERYGKCYRIGGDEFCCVIPKAAGCQIERQIWKMRQEITILNHKRMIPVDMEIACGYARYETDEDTLEKMRARADEMMYQNKKELKNTEADVH